MDFANKENEEELGDGENDVEEAMLDELEDEDEADVADEELLGAVAVADPLLIEDVEEDEADDDEDGLIEDDAEDVDFDSFDDEDHL
jgi:hypothetical protein